MMWFQFQNTICSDMSYSEIHLLTSSTSCQISTLLILNIYIRRGVFLVNIDSPISNLTILCVLYSLFNEVCQYTL